MGFGVLGLGLEEFPGLGRGFQDASFRFMVLEFGLACFFAFRLGARGHL